MQKEMEGRGQGKRKRNECATAEGCNGSGRARLKPGARNFIQISHMGGRNSSTWAFFCVFVVLFFLRPLAGSWIGSEAGRAATDAQMIPVLQAITLPAVTLLVC